jgi:hypothetical protein
MLPLGELHVKHALTWNWGTNSEFALGPRKTMENLDRVGRSQDLPGADWFLVSSPALNTRALILVFICAVYLIFSFFFSFSLKSFISCFHKHFYLCLIWIHTRPFIIPAEEINACMQQIHMLTNIHISACVILWLSINLEVHCRENRREHLQPITFFVSSCADSPCLSHQS